MSFYPVFLRTAVFAAVCVLSGWLSLVQAADTQAYAKPADTRYPTTPIRHDGKKWRIGYYQSGDYESYQKTLIAILGGLMELGWVDKAAIPTPNDPRDTQTLWAWMCKDLHSDFLEFVSTAYWTPAPGKDQRNKLRQQVLARLNQQPQDLDLMLVMGTKAGQDLASNDHHIPTVVASTTDPIAAQIIRSVEDSGFDHIHAKIDPTRHEQQVRLFHEIIGFKRLGVVYENSLAGRSFGAIDSVEKIAQELHFELVPCYAPFSDLTNQEAAKNLERCHVKLADQVDALYLTRHPGATTTHLPALLAPLNQHQIPTFSQAGGDDVKYGVLISMATSAFKYVGRYHAEVMAKIFNGAKPRDLSQFFQSPPKIAINLATAKLIHYEPPIDMLGAADEIYDTIALPEPKTP